MKEIINQFAVLGNLILQQFPEDHRAVIIFFFVYELLMIRSIFTAFITHIAVKHALSEYTKISKKMISALADWYTMKYAFFWEYYPVCFLTYIVERLMKCGKYFITYLVTKQKRRKKND
jgi:hypothetical protein